MSSANWNGDEDFAKITQCAGKIVKKIAFGRKVGNKRWKWVMDSSRSKNLAELEDSLAKMRGGDVTPVLSQLKALAESTREAASALAREWQTAGIDTIQSLSVESERLMETVHRLHCAWSELTPEAWSADPALQANYADTQNALEALTDRLRAPDAKPILASAVEFLSNLRAQLPEDSEAAYWWHLHPNGPVNRAFEETRYDAVRATDFFHAIAGEGVKSTAKCVTSSIAWGRTFALPVAAADSDLDKPPSPELQKAFERLPHPCESDVRQEIVGEGPHLFTRRLDSDWRILVDVHRSNGQPASITAVLFGDAAFEQASPTRWILDLAKIHTAGTDYKKLLQSLEVTFVFKSGTRVTLL